MSERELPEGLDPDVLHRVVTIEAETETLGNMLHEARTRTFTFCSDEPSSLGGDDNHPAPLNYMTAAIGL